MMKKKSEKPTRSKRSRKAATSKPGTGAKRATRKKSPTPKKGETTAGNPPGHTDEHGATMVALKKEADKILKLIRAGFTTDLRD